MASVNGRYHRGIEDQTDPTVRYAVLLRGVNVGGKALLPMGQLRARLGDAGYTNVLTYIQSGNVVFDAATRRETTLAGHIGALITEHFGLTVPVMVRRQDELASIVDHNPFAGRLDQPAKIGVGFASVELPADIAMPDGSVDQLVVRGRELYLFCPNGFGRAKLPNLDRVCATPITVRNWNTVLKLRSMTAG